MRGLTSSKVRAISYPDPNGNRHCGERQVGGDLHTGGALQLGEVASSWWSHSAGILEIDWNGTI